MPELFDISLKEPAKQDILDQLHDNLGIDFDFEYLQPLLEEHMDVTGDILAFGAGDTEVRERLVSLVTQDLVGRECPTYGEVHRGFDSEAFFERVVGEAESRGIGKRVVWD